MKFFLLISLLLALIIFYMTGYNIGKITTLRHLSFVAVSEENWFVLRSPLSSTCYEAYISSDKSISLGKEVSCWMGR